MTARMLVSLILAAVLVAPVAVGAAPPPPASTPTTLTLDIVDVPLAQALATIARAGGVNLIVQGEATGTVSLHLAHQTFAQALAILADTYHLDVRTVNGTYIVQQLTGGPAVAAYQPPQATSTEVVVRTYRLRYAMASEIVDELRTALGIASPPTTGQQTVVGQPPSATTGSSSGIVGTPGTTGPNVGAPSGAGYGAPSAPAAPSMPAPTSAPRAPAPSPGGAGGTGAGGQGAIAIVGDERTNAIVVSAPYPIQEQIEQVIATLDRPGGPAATIPGAEGQQVVPNTYRYPVHYADPQAMGTTILADVPGTSIVTDLRTHTLLVTGDAAAQRRVAALLQSLDTPTSQVVIQAEILDLAKSAASQLGIQWTYQPFQLTQNPDATLQGSGVFPIIATLNALVTNGQGRVLANPQVATQDGVQADINVGTTLYIPVNTVVNGVVTTQLQTVNAGLLLQITPRLNTAGEVTNTINVQANSITGYSPQGYPEIEQRTVQSIMTVHDGTPILIGGLISQSTTKIVQKIPVLGDIPLIGELFKYTNVDNEYDNIVIVLTPRILAPSASAVLGSSTN